jgi:hypothetical protein
MEHSRSTSYAASAVTMVMDNHVQDMKAEMEEKTEENPLAPYPEGGRGWLVVLGCANLAAVSVGFGYVKTGGYNLYEKLTLRASLVSTCARTPSM